MTRDQSNRINFLLDNWVPPIIRDNNFLMHIMMKLAVGPKYKYYMQFKDKVPYMTEIEINNYYEILGDTFVKRDTDLNRACVDYILNNLMGDSVLDAASGRGYMARLIAAKIGKCTAMDIVTCQSNDNSVEHVQGSLTNMPFEDKSFDTVICTHALEHIKDVDMAIKELNRVCKKRLIIVIPRQREYRYTFDLHINFYPYKYNVESLLSMFEKKDIQLLNGDWCAVITLE